MTNADFNNGNPLILVLTCKLSPPERISSARQQIKSAFPNCNLQIVDGYIGTDAKVSEITDSFKMALLTKRPLTPSEVATYATHRLGLETLVKSNSDFALILEDDFHFVSPETVVECVKNADQLFSTGCDMVKFFDFPKYTKIKTALVKTIAGIDLVRWRRPHAGMVAYLVSREGAKKVLSREKIFRAIDEDIKYFWELNLDIWSIPGNSVVDAGTALGGSLLEQDRKKSRKKTILRSLHGWLLGLHRSLKNAREFKKYCATKNIQPVVFKN